tara:strand:+ start:246 stop:869 length:624 start_codon:yes stop_codon:yes gene_type:complete
MQQQNLFGKKIIRSVSFNEQEIIRDILYLHCNNNPIECDPTYSIGNFYKKGLTKPKYKFDIEPQTKEVIKSCSTNLPLNDNSINVLMFDPPFMFEKRNRENKNIMNKRFSMYNNGFEELKHHYKKSLLEFSRVLNTKGILIFKCQDYTDSKITLTHTYVYKWAEEVGFSAKDLFILLSKGAIANKNLKQRHARKYHSYFYVFELQKK